MRKIFLLIGILWLSFGCSADEPTETVEDNNNTPIDNIVSTNENTEVITEFITHELNQVEYQVENTWIEENSTMNMKSSTHYAKLYSMLVAWSL